MVCILMSVGCLGNNVVAGNYNLVLANASMLQAERPATEEDRVRLIWAQLLLAFRYVSPGGSLVLSIDTRPHDWVVDVITVLTLTFNPNSIKVIPPRNHYTKRSTAYILCRGYGSSGNGGLTNLFISRLGEALRNRNSKFVLTRRPRPPIAHCLQTSDPRPRISEITDQMIIGMQGHAYTAFMLLKPVWSIQYECVRARLRERLLRNPGSHGEFNNLYCMWTTGHGSDHPLYSVTGESMFPFASRRLWLSSVSP